ncbi:hypothetical protein RMN57_13245 [Kitasatospora sp. CM 4170]|uniref:Uncharacterized protein n=1 Tax=Kitasatospora aburaviensis TaxID=67265 RepID=A0ABW1ERQ7_9ACTN|nr:hypothetical protein [Kitasatospora sp. CM 4170]WNM45620.1 hypothetical protein RMN57_13245 [Kitasatospora sp. CM 4170]
MSGIPGWLLRHQVSVEPYLGDSAYGPRYGPLVVVRCFLDQATRLVRAADGREVTSSSTVYARLDTVAPAGSRITLPDGRHTTVIAALRRDGSGLGTPDHLEVQLV